MAALHQLVAHIMVPIAYGEHILECLSKLAPSACKFARAKKLKIAAAANSPDGKRWQAATLHSLQAWQKDGNGGATKIGD